MRRYHDAIRVGESAIANNPNDAEASNGLGVVLHYGGRSAWAATRFRASDGAESFLSRNVPALSRIGLLSIATIRGSRKRPHAADLPHPRQRLSCAPSRHLWPDGPPRRGAGTEAGGLSGQARSCCGGWE